MQFKVSIMQNFYVVASCCSAITASTLRLAIKHYRYFKLFDPSMPNDGKLFGIRKHSTSTIVFDKPNEPHFFRSKQFRNK